MTAGPKKSDSENDHCALTVRLTFADRVDVEDAVETMEHCITDALSFEPSIEELQPVDAGPGNQVTGEQEKAVNARYALTARLTFTDQIDADDAVDRLEHCILKALTFEPSIADA